MALLPAIVFAQFSEVDLNVETTAFNVFELKGHDCLVGSTEFNRLVLEKVSVIGERDKIVGFIFDQVNRMSLGVEIYYYKQSLFITWIGSDSKRRINTLKIEIFLDKNKKPVRVVSVLTKSSPIPEPKLRPSFETPLTPPPARN